MATLAAKAMRNREARDRLESGLERVARRLGVDVPGPAPTRLFDMDLVPIMEIERFAGFVESVDMKLEEMAGSEEAPENRETWTMQMLRDYAKDQEIEIPAEANKRKADLVAFLEEYESRKTEEDDPNGSDKSANSPPDASAADEAPRAGSTSGPVEGSGGPIGPGTMQPGTGTVKIEPDGSQTVVEPAKGTDQKAGDTVPAADDQLSEDFKRKLEEAEG